MSGEDFGWNGRGRGGGWFSEEEEAWEGEGRWGNVCGEGGGGLNFFFGPEIPTKEKAE